jgi:hypothetical protein
MKQIHLAHAELLERFFYDPQTGVMSYRKNGKFVGAIDVRGYVRATVDGKQYKVHRLIYYYMTGEQPTMDIDHDNHVRHDNRWTNLKHCPHNVNARNLLRGKPSGLPQGVYKSKGKWGYQAVVQRGEKKTTLGSFKTPELASARYQAYWDEVNATCP